MERKALEKAKSRYRVATSSAATLENATTYEAFGDQWYIFLHAAKGIYTTLEQGAKTSPQARQWFGARNQERKDDPLLRYVTEARNDDEHGIELSTEVKPQTLAIGVASEGSSKVMRDQWGNTFENCGTAWHIEGGHPQMANLPVLTPLDGKPVISVFTPQRIVLKDVHDRSKQAYPPPKTHIGKDLESGSPIEVAMLMLDYLKHMLEEAEGFCKP